MKDDTLKMKELVELWQQSTMTIKQFCLLHGVSRTRFYYWKNKVLLVDDNEKKSSFQKMHIPNTNFTGVIEYIHPLGHRLIFHQQVDVELLKTLFV
jgi:ACT domain-containing protein